MEVRAMKTYEIIGYAYEADCHCLACTERRFGMLPDDSVEFSDDEGNPPHPIFAGDEGAAEEFCGDCGCNLLPAEGE